MRGMSGVLRQPNEIKTCEIWPLYIRPYTFYSRLMDGNLLLPNLVNSCNNTSNEPRCGGRQCKSEDSELCCIYPCGEVDKT